MLKKKIKWITLSGIAALATFPIISCSSDVSKNNQSYKLGHKSFASKSELLDYVQQRTAKDSKQPENQSGQWRMDGVDRVFDSPKDIDTYIQSHNIQSEVASITLDNDSFQNITKDYFASVPANSVIPLKTNDKDEVINPDKGMAMAYKGNNDQIYFVKADEPDTQIDLIRQAAKNSWIQFHSVYKFNGIYFRNTEDLDYYLRKTIYDKAVDKTGDFSKTINQEVNLPIAKNDGKFSYESFILPKLPDGTVDEKTLSSILTEKIKAHSEKVLSYKNTNGDVVNVSKDDIGNSNLDASGLQNHINSWNFGSQDQTSYYVVDTEKGSRGTLHGNYFLNSPSDIGGVSSINGQKSGIMNTNGENGGASWLKDSATPSTADLQDSSNADSELMGSVISEGIANMINSGAASDENLKEFGMYDVLKFENKENDFTTFLNNISRDSGLTYRMLGDGLKNISNTLKSGKKYNAFYSLPVLRGWTVSRLLENRVSQENLEKANNYFIDVAKDIQDQINKDLGGFLVDNNTLDLNNIYEFDNHNSSLYVDPRTNLGKVPDNVKNELRVAQAVKSYTSNYLTYVPLHKMIKDLESVESNKFSPIDLINFNATSDRKELALLPLLVSNSNTSGSFLAKLETKFDEFKKWFTGQSSIVAENKIIKTFNDTWKGNASLSSKKTTLENSYNDFLSQLNSGTQPVGPVASATSSTEFSKFMDGNGVYQSIKGIFDNTKTVAADVKDILKVVEKANKLVSKLEKVLTFCAYLEVAFVAVDIIMSIVDFFTPKTTQIFYSYKSPDGKKYFWDGGEHVTQFMGLISKVPHDISDLKMLPPIKITVSHLAKASERAGTASNFYFDGKFYNGESSIYNTVANDILAKLNQNDNKNIATQKEYDAYIKTLEDYLKVIFDDGVTLSNKMADDTWTNSKQGGTTLAALVAQKVTAIVEEAKPNSNTPKVYLKNIYSTPNGMVQDKDIAADAYVKDIINKIKPTYVFQRPKTTKDVLTQLPFRLPYPYFSLTSNSITNKKDGEEDELAGLQIEYNSNIDPTSKDSANINIKSSIANIIKDNLAKIGENFNVPEREVSYREVLTTNKFSELKGNIFIRNMYVSKSPMGQIKYFLNLSAAILWIRTEYNTRLSLLNSNINQFTYHSELDHEDHVFTSLTSEMNWIMKNEVTIVREME